MSITVNGQSCVPPGFRFHPTEEELLNYYLKKKVASLKIDLDVIRDVDLNKLEPWDIQEKCRIGSTPQNDWYFFSHKDKKYPTGTRTNRATAAGFWKATGRDKVIYTSSKRIGMRKTLVFYKGRAPHGQKSDWIMHEYRLDDHSDSNSLSNVANSMLDASMSQEEGWVVCRVFKKKNVVNKASENSNSSPNPITPDAKTHHLIHSSSDAALDQILQYMGRSCKQETPFLYSTSCNERFMKLPPLESRPSMTDQDHSGDVALTDWVTLDRLVASQLNGQSDTSRMQLVCFDDPTFISDYNINNRGGGSSGSSSSGDGDLWSLASSATDHVGHASHPSA